jgi:AraC family transcriptional activator of tynA and feaB
MVPPPHEWGATGPGVHEVWWIHTQFEKDRASEVSRPGKIRSERWAGGFDPQVIDPKAFAGWVRPIIYGLTAAEVGSNAHVVERTHRNVRVDGADHYVVLFQLAGRSAMTHNEEAVRFSVGDVVLVDVGRPATFFAGNAGESWNTMALLLPRQALVSHLGFEPRGGLSRRNGTVVGCLLLDLIRNAGEEEVPPLAY